MEIARSIFGGSFGFGVRAKYPTLKTAIRLFRNKGK